MSANSILFNKGGYAVPNEDESSSTTQLLVSYLPNFRESYFMKNYIFVSMFTYQF